MTRPLRAWPAGPGDVPGLLGALRAALDGTGPAVLPVAPDAPVPPRDGVPGGVAVPAGAPDGAGTDDGLVDGAGTDGVPIDGGVPDDVAVVVRTSGSTGGPRDVLLTAAALRASAAATDARLGGPAHWLLTLPAHHVAGLQVLVRSLLGGTEPVVARTAGGFTAAGFAADTGRLPAGRRYVSLVPTQLHRLLDDDAGRAALLRLDAVLVGGASTPAPLLARARAAGVRVVTTYGMTETCGGCVYDGVPLDGVDVRVDDDGGVLLAGPVLARGYRGRPDLDAEAFTVRDGRRVLRTRDLGRLDDGRLTVLGRVDDVLVTGGVKVAPAAVEREVAGLPGVAEVCVVGVPDDEWGQAVVAVVVPERGAEAPSVEMVRARVAATLGAPAAPRHLVLVERLPSRGPGKVDRRGAAGLAADRLSGRAGPARPAG